MKCKNCGKWVDTLKGIHKCKKKKNAIADSTNQLNLQLNGSYENQSLYWRNWHTVRGWRGEPD